MDVSLEGLGTPCYYLTPDQHRAKDNLQAIKEVVTHDNDRSATRSPSLAWAYRLDARGGRQ